MRVAAVTQRGLCVLTFQPREGQPGVWDGGKDTLIQGPDGRWTAQLASKELGSVSGCGRTPEEATGYALRALDA